MTFECLGFRDHVPHGRKLGAAGRLRPKRTVVARQHGNSLEALSSAAGANRLTNRERVETTP